MTKHEIREVGTWVISVTTLSMIMFAACIWQEVKIGWGIFVIMMGVANIFAQAKRRGKW